MLLQAIGTFDHFDFLDLVVDTKLFEHIEAVYDISEGRIASIHKVQTRGRQLGFIEEQKELRGAIVESLIGVSPTCLLYTSPSPRD